MEKMRNLIDAYKKYLDSLRNEVTDDVAIKTYYSAMKIAIQDNCEEWLKKHMLQDSFINCLRANRGKTVDVKPSSRIQLLMESLDENLGRVKKSIVLQKEVDGEKVEEVRFSWLPTLYDYFNPKTLLELEEMEKELNQMHSVDLVSDEDYSAIVHMVFNTFKGELQRLSNAPEKELIVALQEA